MGDPFDAEIEQYLIRSILLVDADGSSSARITRILSEIRGRMVHGDSGPPIVDATVTSLSEARVYIETHKPLIVIIDPGVEEFKTTLDFIEELRNSRSHIIWTLYCHDHWWQEHRESVNEHPFGPRIKNYFAISKSRTDDELRRDVLAVFVKCQADFALQLLMETIGALEGGEMTVAQKAKFVDKATRTLTLLLLDEPKSRVNQRTAFVSMPFDTERRVLYKFVIEPNLIDVGLTPVMMEEHGPGEPIAVAAFRAIGLAELVVCDLTGGNPNVLFELGVAYRAGKKVVRIAKRGSTEDQKLPFMVRGDVILFYDNQLELAEKLPKAIQRAQPWSPR